MKRWPNRLFLDRLALPHMSTNFWMCFCGILFNFQGLRRTFPKSVLELKTTVDHQIWGNTPIGWHKMDGPMGALLQVMIQIDTNRWRWLQIALMADLQAIDPTADVENSIKQYRICKPQLMPVKTMTRALWFLQKAGKKLLARKVADLKSCWRQKLLARKVAGLKSCWRQKLLRWSEVLIKTPFFGGFLPVFCPVFAWSLTICIWDAFFAKKRAPFDLLWP